MPKKTIGNRLPRSTPRYEIRSSCDYCAVEYYRSRLSLTESGLLTCPRCKDVGRDTVALNRKNSAMSREHDAPIVEVTGTFYPFDINEESTQIQMSDSAWGSLWGEDFWGEYPAIPDIGV